MAKEKIRDWVLTDLKEPQGPVLKCARPDRAPLIIAYEPGMDREVLLEYATTRVLEAEIADAGDAVPADLQRTYDAHIEESRWNQQGRQRALARTAEGN